MSEVGDAAVRTCWAAPGPKSRVVTFEMELADRAYLLSVLEAARDKREVMPWQAAALDALQSAISGARP